MDNEDKKGHDNEKKDNQFPFEDIQKQIQNAIKNLGTNSFVIPIHAKRLGFENNQSEEKTEDNSWKVLEIIRNFNFKPREKKSIWTGML